MNENYSVNDSHGFTLLELLLAAVISAIVLGMVATALSFCVRIWERQNRRLPDDMGQMLDLMALQLGSFNDASLRYKDKQQTIFFGDTASLTFTTNYSLKSISKGVPIIARYYFSKGERTLYYGEMPLNAGSATAPKPNDTSLSSSSHDSNSVEGFIAMDPRGEKGPVSFYPVNNVADFSIAYMEDKTKREHSGGLSSLNPAPTNPGQQQRTPGKGNERGWKGDPSPLDHLVVRMKAMNGAVVQRLLFPEFLSFQAVGENAVR